MGITTTMVAIWYIQGVGLNPFQLVILGTIFEIAITICEIPTGIVADLYSRKLSMSLGYILSGCAYLLIALVPQFWACAAGAVIWGVGETFLSGAREAWVADEIGHGEDEGFSADDAFVMGRQWGLYGRIAGTWISFFALLIAKGAPQIFGDSWQSFPIGLGAGLLLAFGVFVHLIYPEKGFHRSKEGFHGYRAMFDTFRQGWKIVTTKGGLIVAIMVVFLTGLSSEPFDRLWQDLLEEHFRLPLVMGAQEFWWSLLNSLAMLLTIVVLAAMRRHRTFGTIQHTVKTLGVFNIIVFAGLLLFGLTQNIWLAMGAFLIVRTVRRAFEPLITAWINANATSNVRATLLSFAGQTESAGEIIAGPTLGLVAGRFGNRMAMLASAGILGIGLFPLATRLRAVPDQNNDTEVEIK